jgi:hypothetical protein
MTWNQERFLLLSYTLGSLIDLLTTTLTPDRQPLPCEQLVGLGEESRQQGDSAEGQDQQGAPAFTVGAQLMMQVSAHNLIEYALQKSASSPPFTHATSHAMCAPTLLHTPVDG